MTIRQFEKDNRKTLKKNFRGYAHNWRYYIKDRYIEWLEKENKELKKKLKQYESQTMSMGFQHEKVIYVKKNKEE